MLGNEKVDKKLILKDKLKTITRSLFYISDLKKGQKVKKNDIKSIRPGIGLELNYYEKIIGKKVKKHCYKGQPVQKKDF